MSNPIHSQGRVVKFTIRSVPGHPNRFTMNAEGTTWMFDVDQISVKSYVAVTALLPFKVLGLFRRTTRRQNIRMMMESLNPAQKGEFIAMTAVKAILHDGGFLNAFLDHWRQGMSLTLSTQR